jgi:hypothetical protein
MKKTLFIWLSIFAGVAFAENHLVPTQYLGKWASSKIECTRDGRTTLTITSDAVLAYSMKGRINVGWTPQTKSIEVVFSANSDGPHQPGVRTFTWFNDGATLREFKGGEIVSDRQQCDGSKK